MKTGMKKEIMNFLKFISRVQCGSYVRYRLRICAVGAM